jgi:pyruvate formate lyase activating enzyme
MPNAVCSLCPFNCDLPEGRIGKCRVRGNVNGKVELLTYGMVTTAEVGPIEQKPIYHFHPGMKVLSIGGSGCNMFCGYCQNWEISQVKRDADNSTRLSPEAVVKMAKEKRAEGIAFTYSEPFVWYEYVMDVARAAKRAGLKTILKTNGYGEEAAFVEMFRLMDAVNFDIKGTAPLYKAVCGIEVSGACREWNPLRNLAGASRAGCHVEASTLAIPGYLPSDDLVGVKELLKAIAGASGEETPLHILKFIPDFKMINKRSPTQAELDEYHRLASEFFRYAYVDFNLTPADTVCRCGEVLVKRLGIKATRCGFATPACPRCREPHNFVL